MKESGRTVPARHRRALNQRLRAAFVEGAEEDSRRRLGARADGPGAQAGSQALSAGPAGIAAGAMSGPRRINTRVPLNKKYPQPRSTEEPAWVFACSLILLPISLVLTVLVLVVGIDLLSGTIVKIFAGLGGQAVLLLVGAGMLILSIWAVLRVATGRSAPGVTTHRALVTATVLGVLGAAAILLGLFAYQPGPSF